MGRTKTKDVSGSSVAKTTTPKKKKSDGGAAAAAGKADAGEQKKKRRIRAPRYAYEVRKGAKAKGGVLQSNAREVLAAVFEDTVKRATDMLKNMNTTRVTIKALDARCFSGYFVDACGHNGVQLTKELAPIHDRIDAQLHTDKEERRAQKGK
jgi:hypothetical protein